MAQVTSTSMQTEVPTTEVSVIMASYNAWKTMQKCLAPTITQAQQHKAEIIIVDSSTDGTEKHIAEQYPQIRLLHSSVRLYPEEAKQIGVNHARGKLIVLLDADCMPGEHWLSAKLSSYREGHIASMGPVYCHPECSAIGWAYFFVEFSFFLQYVSSEYIQNASNCNFAFDKMMLADIPLSLNQSYSADAVFFRNILSNGHKIYFNPYSEVYHYFDGTFKDFLKHEFIHGKDGAQITAVNARMIPRTLAYLLAGPILPVLKLASILRYLHQNHLYRVYRKFWAALPLTFCGATAWTWGAWWGVLLNLRIFLVRKRVPVLSSHLE